jgi:dTMP kinase
MSSRRGLFLVLEGPDKSGKSTQARLLVEELKAAGHDVVHTREPGGTSFAEEVRTILLDPKHSVQPLAELLLYEAARAQHTEELLKPALREGKVVVCERYTLSTVVYQGYGRGLDLKVVDAANRLATGGLTPDLTFVIEIPDSEFSSRDAERAHDRLEREPESFRGRVRRGYRMIAQRQGVVALDGRKPVEDIRREIRKKLEPFLRGRRRAAA